MIDEITPAEPSDQELIHQLEELVFTLGCWSETEGSKPPVVLSTNMRDYEAVPTSDDGLDMVSCARKRAQREVENVKALYKYDPIFRRLIDETMRDLQRRNDDRIKAERNHQQ